MLICFCCMFNFQDLPDDIRVAQEKKLEELKRQQELQNQLAVQRTLQLRDRKIKFFGLLSLPVHFKFLFSARMYLPFSWCWYSNYKERRKIERMIRRLEKQQRSNGDGFSNNLSTLREDLEYVRVSFLHYWPALPMMIWDISIIQLTFPCCIVLFALDWRV